MKILAIDPGPTQSAWLVWDDGVQGKGLSPNDVLLEALSDPYDKNIEHLAIEMVQSFGMSVGAEVFETVFWIGRFCQAWDKPFTRVFRKDVKIHLCGSMRAKDPNIRQALIDRFGPPGTKKMPGRTFGVSGHLWSALAVAITFADKNGATV